MPRRVRRWAGIAVMSCPSNTMRPPSVGSEPETQLISVVLPEPLGPISPNRSPGLTAMLTPLSAMKPPKRLVSAVISSSGAAIGSASPQPAHEPEDALGGEDDEGHEHDADDEEVQLGGDRHRRQLLRGAQQHGADHRPHPARRAADHRHGYGVLRVVQG